MDSKLRVEMSFCRRCGNALKVKTANIFECEQGHTLFLNAGPAPGLMLRNDRGEVLMAVRSIEPGKGRLTFPGGFCNASETLEEALAREVVEEIGLTPEHYTKPEYLLSVAFAHAKRHLYGQDVRSRAAYSWR